jgi:DNA-binding beta-propeller fold protein YncE
MNISTLNLNIHLFVENNNTINSSIGPRSWYPRYHKSGRIVAGYTSNYGNDLNHLNYPSCVYLDSKKNVYICDTNNNRIMKYSPDNPKEGITIVDFFSKISEPRDLYIDQQNDGLYFLDGNHANYYRVLYLQKNSIQTEVVIILIGNKCQSFGMDFDNHRNIYVSEYENHRVVKWLSPNYDEFIVVAGNGKQGKLLNQLTNPRGIYINKINNDLYIADYNRIQLWTSGSTIGKTIVRTPFFSPYGIKLDSYGNLYVTDDYTHTVQLFSQSVEDTGLEGITIFGTLYTGVYTTPLINITDHLNSPRGLYLDDTNGDLYVADSNFHRILKTSINGQFIPGRIKQIFNKNFKNFI